MARPHLILALVTLLACPGCMGTDDYLNDLYTVQGSSDGTLPLDVYDAGQLAHEAFSGLIEQRELTLAQMGRAVAYAGRAAYNSEVPLLRAQGVALLAHIAVIFPVRPISEPLNGGSGIKQLISEQVTALGSALDRLRAGRVLIPMLDSPDQADVERALADLEKTTGQAFGRDKEAWRSWWEANAGDFEKKVGEEALEPLKILGSIQYERLLMAHLVLQLISTSLSVADMPALHAEIEKSMLNVARQVIEMGIAKGLADDDSSLVRAEAALAAGIVRAPSFGGPLAQASVATQDQDAKTRLLAALRWYPGKDAMVALISSLQDDRQAVQFTASTVLSLHTGEAYGQDYELWRQWWNREGKIRWP